MSHMPTSVAPPALELTRGIVSIKDYGGRGDNATDDTDALERAATAARAQAGPNVLGAAVYLPSGSYRFTRTPSIPSFVRIQGESRFSTTLRWDGPVGVGARMFEFADKYGVGFQDLRVSLPTVAAPNTVTAFYLSNCFRFSLQRVYINGGHAVGTPDPQSTGIEFRNNAGDNRVIDCDLNNLGVGIRTSAIQNYVVGCVFGTNKYSIYGDGGTFGAGMVVQASTFVGTGATGGTETHIIVDRSANMWRILGCWFEGCRKGIQIGATGVGGPTEFGVIGCKIAAVDLAIDVQNCTLPYLANLTLAADPTGTPVTSYADIAINATDAPSGTATGVRSGAAFDLTPGDFPKGWTVMRRGAMRLPEQIDVTDPLTFTGDSAITMVTTADVVPLTVHKNNTGNTSDLFQVKKAGTTYAWVDTFGVLYAQAIAGAGYVQVGSTGSTRWYKGTGSPEGVVTASVGSLYSRTDGGASTTLYVKESGAGNTGWVAK